MKISISLQKFNQSQWKDILEKYKDFIDDVHVDIIEGEYANGGTNPFDFDAISFLLSITDLKINVHLMVMDEFKYLEKLQKFNSRINFISFHPEGKTEEHIKKVVNEINFFNNASFAFQLNTDISKYNAFSDQIRMAIILMSVPIGFSGQKFNDDVFQNVIATSKTYSLPIYIDGGISPHYFKLLNDQNIVGGIISSSFFDNADALKLLNKYKNNIQKG